MTLFIQELEIVTLLPLDGSFIRLAGRMVDPALGVAVGYNHFVSLLHLGLGPHRFITMGPVRTDFLRHFRSHGHQYLGQLLGIRSVAGDTHQRLATVVSRDQCLSSRPVW